MLDITTWFGRASQGCEDFTDAAPARAPRVVRSSYGRLRVHLPHWSGARADEIGAAARRFAGVTHAEANPYTGNLLLQFEPAQTSASALLAALSTLHLPASPADSPAAETVVRVAAVNGGAEVMHSPPAPYVTGFRRVVYKGLGWASVGMAVVGAIVPGIPTVPFVVLAGYFFVRSSPEAHQWLRQSRWFGTMLRDWEEHRAVRRSVRNAATALIVGSMILTPLLGLPAGLVATILSLQVVGLLVVRRVPVIENPPPALTLQVS